jgi:hypothetical protein
MTQPELQSPNLPNALKLFSPGTNHGARSFQYVNTKLSKDHESMNSEPSNSLKALFQVQIMVLDSLET